MVSDWLETITAEPMPAISMTAAVSPTTSSSSEYPERLGASVVFE